MNLSIGTAKGLAEADEEDGHAYAELAGDMESRVTQVVIIRSKLKLDTNHTRELLT